MSAQHPGHEAIAAKGWIKAHQWLLLRRGVQLAILVLFLIGPWFGIWIIKGNLSSSLILDSVPLTDPYILLQSLAAGHTPYKTALIGAGIVLAFYLLLGGRTFCSWVCPVNMVTDAAAWLRRRLGLKGGRVPAADTRLWLLGLTFVAALFTGSLAWEWVNPVSMLQRGLIYGFGLTWGIVLALFLYDLLIAPRGWCGHLCPMGAFYGLLNRCTPLRIAAAQREACNDCLDCFAVCPEPQVIRPALKGQGSRTISHPDCTSCGRCIDVCSQDVFNFSLKKTQRSVS